MKIRKWVDIRREIEIEIDGEEAVNAIIDEPCEDWGPKDGLLRACNNCAAFFKRVQDSTIAELNDYQKTVIHAFFEEQAKRYQ